jgi:hypothetical protein
MEIIRDSALGHFIHFVSRGKCLQHQEEAPGFGTRFLQEDFESQSTIDIEKTTTLHQTTTRAKDGTILVGWYSDSANSSCLIHLQRATNRF